LVTPRKKRLGEGEGGKTAEGKKTSEKVREGFPRGRKKKKKVSLPAGGPRKRRPGEEKRLPKRAKKNPKTAQDTQHLEPVKKKNNWLQAWQGCVPEGVQSIRNRQARKSAPCRAGGGGGGGGEERIDSTTKKREKERGAEKCRTRGKGWKKKKTEKTGEPGKKGREKEGDESPSPFATAPGMSKEGKGVNGGGK